MQVVNENISPQLFGSKKDTAKNGKADKGGNNSRTIEQMYQKKSQLEHILLRPDTYVGSVEVIA